jgi:tetratricopeptide (TPR) repeat protein
MDIDDFLDKEVQEEKKEGDEDVSSQVTEDQVEEPAVEGTAPEVSEAAAASGETGAVKNYFQLWGKVSEAKFKWDSKLYEEVEKEGNKVKEEIAKSLLTAGRDKKEIKRLIGKAITELENENYEAATNLYSEISDMRNNFPDFLLEEKKDLNKEIFLLYEQLHDKIDVKFINDFKVSIVNVSNFVKDSLSSLRSGDTEKAKVLYEHALKAYKSLPNGLLQEKMELGRGLLKLYKDLSIQAQIKDLQHQLSREASGRYSHTDSENKLMHLGNVKQRYPGREFNDKGPSVHNPTLMSNLISRKLDRARINLKRGLYPEAKKNIDSILRVDPNNAEAKQMLSSIHAKH